MKTARVAVIGVALVAGLAAALLARQLLNRPAPTVVAAGPSISTTDVLVASRDLPMGSALDTAAFSWQAWPKTGVSGGYITRDARPGALAELTGSIARSSFVTGEPINEAKLIRSDRGFMSAILPAGQRAVATAISADTSAGGFILPNDRVDVIMTRKADSSGRDEGERLAIMASSLVALQLAGESPLLRTNAYQALPLDLRGRMLKRTDQVARHIAGTIADGIADGSMRAVDPEIAGHAVMATIDAAGMLRRWAERRPLDSAVKLFAGVVQSGIF